MKRAQVANDAEAGHTLAGRGECMHLSIRTGPNSSASFATVLDDFGTTANPGSGGPGFSLWVARQLARRYGGDVVISSDPERRLTFDLYLPL
jgi:sensor histidine kinase regulating citrate/malate metabolism